MKTKKHRLLALALISSFTLLGAASAAVQYPDGGVWTYGEGSGGGWAFSNYYHGKKYHYSSVVSKWDGHSDKGSAPAGKTQRHGFGLNLRNKYHFNVIMTNNLVF